MRLIVVLVALVVALASAKTITQYWYTDASCAQGLTIVKINEYQCYYDAPDMAGVEWHCNGSIVEANVYAPGDAKCKKQPIGKKDFPPKTCVGPIYMNMYVVAEGCP